MERIPEKPNQRPRVLIVEDQRMPAQVFEQNVTESGRYRLTESIQSADAAYFYCATGQVDLVLMDVITKFGANGLNASARIKRSFPHIKIIIVTSYPEVGWLDRARQIGVDSFWYKEVAAESLLSVMDRTMAGESVYPNRSPRVQLGAASSYDLSKQELAILRDLITGATNAQIAEKNHLAPSTVKTYIERLMDKTGFRSRTELAVRARECGLVIQEE